MMELLDQYERLEIALKLKRGRNKKASKGGYAGGGAALGYRTRRGTKTLATDITKSDTVRRAFELKQANPTWTLQRLATQLNLEGHSTAQGKAFRRIQVKRILDRREFYTGTYCYAGIEAPGQHQAIVARVPRCVAARK
jgi:site-specific DNA recombinase